MPPGPDVHDRDPRPRKNDRPTRRGGALIVMCLSMMVVLVSMNSGLREQTYYEFFGLSSRHAQLQAEYLAQGGLEYLTAWHHRFGEGVSPPRLPSLNPVLDPDLPTTLPNRALKWIDPTATTHYVFRLDWDFRKLDRGFRQIGPVSATTELFVTGPNVDVAGAQFQSWGVQAGDLLELVDTSGTGPDGNDDPAYDLPVAPMFVSGNQVQFLINMRFRSRGLRPGSYLRLQDANQGLAVRWFRISAVRSDDTLSLESARPDGLPDLLTQVTPGHVGARIYPVRRFRIQTVQSETRVRLQSLDPDGLGNLTDSGARPAGHPPHTDVRVVRPLVDLAVGVSLYEDPGTLLLARADSRRTGVALSNTDLNGTAPSRSIPTAADSGQARRAHAHVAAAAATVGGRSQIHLVRTDLDRFGFQGQAQPIESPFDDRDPQLTAGDRVVFLRQIAGTYQVCEMDYSGRDVRQLTNESSNCSSPVVTPDGRFVFYAQPGIGRIRYIPYGPSVGPAPGFPTASTIVTNVNFERNGPFPNADSGELPTAHDELALSPDGRFLAFTAGRNNAAQSATRRCLYVFNLVESSPGVFLTPQRESYVFRTENVRIDAPGPVPNMMMPSAESQFTPAPPGNPIGYPTVPSPPNPGWRIELRDVHRGGMLRHFEATGAVAPVNATTLRFTNYNLDAAGPITNGFHTHIRIYPAGSAITVLPANQLVVYGARFVSHGVTAGDILEIGDVTLRPPLQTLRRFQITRLFPADEQRIQVATLDPDQLGNLTTGDHHQIRVFRPPGPVYRYSSADQDVSGPTFSPDGQHLLVVQRRNWPAGTQPVAWIQGEIVSVPLFRMNLVDRFRYPTAVVTAVTNVGINGAWLRLRGGKTQFEAAGIPAQAGNPPPRLGLELFDGNLGVTRRFEIHRIDFPGSAADANVYIAHRNPDGLGNLSSGRHQDIRVYPLQSGLQMRPGLARFPSGHLEEGVSSDNHGTNLVLTNNSVAEAMPRWGTRGTFDPGGDRVRELYYLADSGGWNLRRTTVLERGDPAGNFVQAADPVTGSPNPSTETSGLDFAPRSWSWSPAH